MTENNVFKKGYEACFQNAVLWLKEGIILYENESYAHACVLWINGLESLIHTWYSWLVYIGVITSTDPEFVKIFKDHKPKFQSFYDFLVGRLIYQTDEKGKSTGLKIEEDEKAIEKWFKQIHHLSSEFAYGLFDFRNKGLYVNFNQDDMTFELPEVIGKEQAIAIRILINECYEVIEHFIHFMNEDEVEKVRQSIKKQNRDISNEE